MKIIEINNGCYLLRITIFVMIKTVAHLFLMNWSFGDSQQRCTRDPHIQIAISWKQVIYTFVHTSTPIRIYFHFLLVFCSTMRCLVSTIVHKYHVQNSRRPGSHSRERNVWNGYYINRQAKKNGFLRSQRRLAATKDHRSSGKCSNLDWISNINHIISFAWREPEKLPHKCYENTSRKYIHITRIKWMISLR